MSEFLSFRVHIPFHLLCILVPILTLFISLDIRFLQGSVSSTQHICSSRTLPQNLVLLVFPQFSLSYKYPSFTLLYFSLNIDLDELLSPLILSSSCLRSSCLFGMNPSHCYNCFFSLMLFFSFSYCDHYVDSTSYHSFRMPST